MITTRCLILDEVQESDFDLFFQLQTDVRDREFLGGPVDASHVKTKFESILKPAENATHWAVRDSDSNFVGLISLDEHHDKQELEMSYQLLPLYWGKGIALEALAAVLAHLKNNLQLKRIIAETQHKNLRSRNLLAKLNMQPLKMLERFGEQQIVYVTAF